MRYWLARLFVEAGKVLVTAGIDVAGEGEVLISFEVRPVPVWAQALWWTWCLSWGAIGLWVYMVLAFSV